MLNRLFRPVAASPRREPKKVSDIDATLNRVQQLPPMSSTITQAIAMANDPECRLQDFVKVVRCDGAITSILLKIVNSPVYCGRRPIQNVDQAVTRIGLKKCTEMISAIGMKRTFLHIDGEVQDRIDTLWRHSLFAAHISAEISAKYRLHMQGEEFTACLFHDVGRLVLAISDPAGSREADHLDFVEADGLLGYEKTVVGLDHTQLGGEYARRNNFPRAFVDTITFHHSPTEAPSDQAKLVLLVTAADHLANHVLRHRKVSNYNPDDCPSFNRVVPIVSSDGVVDRETLKSVVVRATENTRAALKANTK